MCRIWRIYIYIYNTYKKKLSLLHRCCGSSMDWSGQMRNEARWDQQSQWSILYDAHLFYSIHARFSTNTFFFFFFFKLFLRLNYDCFDVYERHTLYEPVFFFFLSPRIVRGKKKRKSYKQIVRARQSALNNIPDSQDRYARAKLWLGLCKKRACCNMLPSEINAILIPFCFLYRSDFSIVRYKYNKIVTIARRKRSFVSEDVLECGKSSYFFLSIYCNRYNFLLFLEFCKRRRCFLSNIYICKNTNFCPKQLHVKSVTRTNSRMHAVCASVFS